ncbi:hypothetical protein QBA75_22920 [Streptomyces stelliscabiei]
MEQREGVHQFHRDRRGHPGPGGGAHRSAPSTARACRTPLPPDAAAGAPPTSHQPNEYAPSHPPGCVRPTASRSAGRTTSRHAFQDEGDVDRRP